MRKTTIDLDDALYPRIRRVAEATGRGQAADIREALDRFIPAETPRAPRSLSLGASAAGELSERAEERLAGMGSDG